jgi:hypothetical protein
MLSLVVETFDISSSVVHAVSNPPAVTQGVDSSFPGASRRNFNTLILCAVAWSMHHADLTELTGSNCPPRAAVSAPTLGK